MEKRISIEDLDCCSNEDYETIINLLESLPLKYRIWEEQEE